jgi:hypothetical protein
MIAGERSFIMIAHASVRAAFAGLVALALVVSPVGAQRGPTPAAIALAKQILTAKGADKMYEPLVREVVERAKGLLLQTNPTLTKDLNEVAAKLEAELIPRVQEILNEVARLYAGKFTEPELKEVLAFYKSRVGQKVIVEEPAILDQSVAFADNWANRLSEEVLVKFRTEMKKRGHEL